MTAESRPAPEVEDLLRKAFTKRFGKVKIDLEGSTWTITNGWDFNILIEYTPGNGFMITYPGFGDEAERTPGLDEVVTKVSAFHGLV